MEYLTTTQVGLLLGVSDETIKRWIVRGHLPGYRPTKDSWYRVERKQLEQYAAGKGITLDWTKLEKSECPA